MFFFYSSLYFFSILAKYVMWHVRFVICCNKVTIGGCCCVTDSHPEIASIKLVLGDCEALSVLLPCADRLRTLLQTASKWTAAVESALVSRDILRLKLSLFNFYFFGEILL